MSTFKFSIAIQKVKKKKEASKIYPSVINRVYPKYHHLKAITIKILTAQYLYVYIAFKVQVMRYLLAYHNWCPVHRNYMWPGVLDSAIPETGSSNSSH